MFAMELTNLIPYLVEQLAPHDTNKALKLSFDVRLSHYTNEKDYHKGTIIEFLFRRNFGHFDTFFRTTTNRFDDKPDWKHTSSHDSGWKTDGLRDINKVYFSMADEIREEVDDENLAPKDLRQFVWFVGHPRNWVDIVDVEVKNDPNDLHNYRKVVKVL